MLSIYYLALEEPAARPASLFRERAEKGRGNRALLRGKSARD